MSKPPLPKPPFTEVALEAVRKIQTPLLLYGIVESVLLIFLLVVGRNVPGALLPIVYTLAGLVLLIAIAQFVGEYRRQASPAPSRVFVRSDSIEFRTMCRNGCLRLAAWS